jgi:hypothetical protein
LRLRLCFFWLLFLAMHALPVGSDVEPPPYLAAAEGFDDPVAAFLQSDRFLEQEAELHRVADLESLALPRFGFRKHLHARQRAPQRHVSFVRVVAGEGGERQRETDRNCDSLEHVSPEDNPRSKSVRGVSSRTSAGRSGRGLEDWTIAFSDLEMA